MNITENKLNETSLELVIDLERADIENDLQKAAKHIGEHLNIPGFRPGQAPYDIVSRHVGGEAKIYEEALQSIVSRTLPKIIIEKKLDTVGRPEISIQKMVPPFGVSYKAVISLMPKVELGDTAKIKVKPKAVTHDLSEVEKVVNQLLEMRMNEVAVERAAQMGDKAVLDFEVKKDNVIIEGGQGKDYHLVLGSGQFIPGFEEQLVGVKPNEEKNFELPFPDNYHAKHLAGAKAQFGVKVKQIFERTKPELTDEFAQSLGGYETAAKLREQIEANVKQDKEAKENERFELECMEELLKLSTVGPVPEKSLDEEVDKMLHELEHSVEDRGLKFADYLQSIKKTPEDLKKDFRSKAEHRLKLGLVAREFGKVNNVVVDEAEVQKEIDLTKKSYQYDPAAKEQFKTPEYRDYVRNVLTSRAIFIKLAEIVLF